MSNKRQLKVNINERQCRQNSFLLLFASPHKMCSTFQFSHRLLLALNKPKITCRENALCKTFAVALIIFPKSRFFAFSPNHTARFRAPLKQTLKDTKWQCSWSFSRQSSNFFVVRSLFFSFFSSLPSIVIKDFPQPAMWSCLLNSLTTVSQANSQWVSPQPKLNISLCFKDHNDFILTPAW